MFDSEPDGVVVAVVEDAARVSAAADARRLAAIAELTHRRCGDGDSRDFWVCDGWSAVAAEISAALNVGHRAATRDMHIGLALRDRLPRIGALFAEGLLSLRVVSTITWRATFVQSTDALAAIDAELAARSSGFTALSDARLSQAIDATVERHDPDALRRLREAVRTRDVRIGKRDDATGTASLWGRLLASDATRLTRLLDGMARQVCPRDPRTVGQRRSEAMGVVIAGGTVLPCRCEHPDCDAATVEDARAISTIIHVLTDPATLDASPDPAMHGEYDPAKEAAIDRCADAAAETPATNADAAAAAAAEESTIEARRASRRATRRPPAAIILGGGVIPAPLLAELIRGGARIQPVRPPSADPEDRYRPSAALADFVRMRDLTCRFPGCNTPAEFTDIDHTTPYPYGPTHPSGLKCACRRHHLVKTFWENWHDRQDTDGTVTWTTPTGRTYTTAPGSRLFFPHWDTASTEMPTTTTPPTTPGRSLMMPTRKRTRAQDHAARVTAHRDANRRYREALTQPRQRKPDPPPPPPTPPDDDPPPF